ncbi:TonB-dependent receptor [Pedobacter yulinensis]|uniref:TonB-dependent receptor n=1 Tax=Pedobacter yulinensis TaxID=2126353 RepID=A0A2T3HRT6_9SPHI|nr:outer membrane beta-barrel family protein [Pedobacter yulinensis]PST85126.1 TonB-dependent receptor [Pedobacter yulinensis]
MRKLFPLLGLLLLFFTTAQAQSPYQIRGNVIDTASSVKLANSSVSILRAKDSTLYKFTRTAADGSFALPNLQQGKYILLVTYPKYADYVDFFHLDSARKEIDFKRINMTLKAKLLADVIIKGSNAITIKGDTTEFNAASFKVDANAKVEDLIRQFPGIQVDKDGKITAQGQTVSKVLVDGEEFFGDDPTLVTKNLRADMVDKVQLFDKTSDQAAFTGIDDGEKAKTLNIKLKEDKKQGYFGKLDGGAGTGEFYQAQGMFNYFKGKKKFSAYGTLGNTGKTGLGWEDSNKYSGGAGNMEFTDDGGIMIFGGGGDDELEGWDGRYGGQGIPLARTGGLHFDNKWDEDKQSINANYKLGSLSVRGNRNNITQNNLPDRVLNTTSDENFDNRIFRQKADAKYTLKIDSTTSLTINADGTLKNSDSESDNLSRSYNGSSLLNENTRNLTSSADDKQFGAALLLTKRFKKKGRTMSVNLTERLSQTETNGFLNSHTRFHDEDGVKDSTINQNKIGSIRSNVFNSNITYTEPITKSTALVLNYGLNLNNGTSDRRSYNQGEGGAYNVLDSTFSNNFELNQVANQVGANINYNKGKTNLSFGTRVTDVKFEQSDLFTGKAYNRNFTNWNPQARFTYKMSSQKSFRISYNGNNTQPSINQIQPIRENTDPLNQVLGNPDLEPSFTNSFSGNYNSYKILGNQYINIYGGYSFTIDPIVMNTVTDQRGASTFQSFNLSGENNSNFYGGGYVGKKIKKVDLDVGMNFYLNGNTFYNMTNNALNRTRNYSYSGNLSFSQYKPKKYNFRLEAGPQYNTSESSLQPDVNNNGWSANGQASFRVYLPGKIEIGSDANYNYRARTQSFNEDFERLLLNASLTKKFFKQENLAIVLSGNDLLNQNIGFDRRASNNLIIQNSYTTIRRYFLFSVIWDFNKMGGK